MKINSISLISVLSSLALMSNANAGVIADFYVGAMAGVGGQTLFADHRNETNTAKSLGIIAGMDIPVVRIEGEYSYLSGSDLDTNAAMLNVYAKLPTAFIKPYIGAGAGVVFGGDHTIEKNNVKTKYSIHSTTAYQAMLGTTIDILALPIKFDVEGRLLYAPDIYTMSVSNSKPDLLDYNLRAKVRFIF